MADECRKSGPGRLVSGGAWFLGLMTLSGVFWLVLGIQINNVYGPEGFGLFNTASSVFDFMWAFIFGGLFEGLIHFGAAHLSEEGNNVAKFFSKYVRYLTLMSIAVFLGLTVAATQAPSSMLRVLFLSLAFAFLVSGTKDALAAILGSLHKNRQLSIVNSIGFYAMTIIGLVLIAVNMPSDLLPVIITFGPITQALLCVYFSRTWIKDLISNNIEYFSTRKLKDALAEDWKDYKQILVFGFSVSVGKISFLVMKSLDIPIMKLYFDFADIGVYSVADTASSVLFSMTAFSLPIISSVSHSWTKQNWDEIEKCVKIAVKLPLILGLPLTVIIFVLAEPIILAIYGPLVSGAVVPLQILINGTFLLMFGHTLSSILIGVGKPKLSGKLMGIAAIQYLISLFVFVPIFGLSGGAISLTLTSATSLVLMPVFIKRTLKIDIFEGLPKVLASAAVLGILLVILNMYISNFGLLLLGTFAGVVVYGLLLYYTGYVTKEDINMIRNPKTQNSENGNKQTGEQ